MCFFAVFLLLFFSLCFPSFFCLFNYLFICLFVCLSLLFVVMVEATASLNIFNMSHVEPIHTRTSKVVLSSWELRKMCHGTVSLEKGLQDLIKDWM